MMDKAELLSFDRDRLAAMSGGEARAALDRVLDAFDRAELHDWDHLHLFGIRLAISGHDNLDLAAVEWIAAQPSSLRLSIGSALLKALWQDRRSAARANASAVAGLIRVQEALQTEHDANYEFLLALARLAAGKVHLEAVEKILETALEKRLSNAAMDSILNDVIRQALGIPSPAPKGR